MSYQRFGTPKIYVDNLNWLMSSGHMSASDITISGLNMASGYSAIEMFDMKPSNLQIITANGLTTQLDLRINTRVTTNSEQDSNFIAILGHNLHSAGAKFSLQLDDDSTIASPNTNQVTTLTNVVNASASATVNTGTTLGANITSTSATTITVQSSHGSRFSRGDILMIETSEGNEETVFVTGVSSDNLTVIRGFNGSTARTFTDGNEEIFFKHYTKPAEDGWSLATFTQTSDNQYIRLVIDPDGNNTDTYSSDIKIGAILIGEAYSFPQSPELEITKQFTFDGLTKQTSVGGQTYANATYTKGANWFLEPFFNSSTATSPDNRFRSGRLAMDLSFNYMADTDVYSSVLNSGASVSSNSFINNLISKTNGGMFPMLFQYDNTVTTDEDAFLWCRLNNEPQFTQVANRVWSTKLNLVEEF
mgnify:FL=1